MPQDECISYIVNTMGIIWITMRKNEEETNWKAHERSKKAEKVGGLQATLCHKQCHAEEHRWKRPSRHTKRETSNKGTMKRLPRATVPTYLVDRERQS